ncbi:hypothetical protein D3C72_1526340 [compost metagenome]
MNRVFAETTTAHAFEVHAARFCGIAEHGDERRNVLADRSAHTGKAVSADVAILVNQGESGKDCPVIHVHMPGQRGVVDQNAVIADDAVMPDVGISHDQVVIAQRGFRTVLHGATVNGHAFTDDIVVTDHQASFFAFVLQIGRVFAYRGKLVDAIVLADAGRAFEDYMRPDHGTLADFHTCADDRPRADLDAISQNGRRIDDCARVNQTHSLRSAQMISAEQTGLPSTEAWHSNFQI